MDRKLGLALSLCLWAVEALARADAAAPHDPPARVVEIIAIPDADRIGMLKDVLGPHPFASATIRWLASDRLDKRDVLRSEPAGGVAVRAWVDLSDPSDTVLYFANGAAQRFLLRELKLSPSFAANDREAVGEVLQLSISALLADPEGGLDRRAAESLLNPPREHADEPSPRAAERPVPPPQVVRPPVDVSLFYAAQAFARQIPIAHGPGIAALTTVRGGRLSLSLWVSAQYQLPSTFEQDGVGVELWSAALRGGVEGAFRLGASPAGRGLSNAFFGASLGVGTDLVHVTPLQGVSGSPADLQPPYWSVDPVVTAALRLQAGLLPRVDVAFAALADVYLVPAHYDFRDGSVTSTVLAPFPIRPGVLVGLAIH